MAKSKPLSSRSSLLPFVAAPVDELPEEILRDILQHVLNESRYSAFVACLVCCRRWHHCGLPMLCSEIVLTDSSIDAFLTGFPLSRCGLIRSLEVLSLGLKGLNSRLCKLAAKMTNMIALSTFSLKVNRNAFRSKAGRLYLNRSLAEVLKNLPKSCVDLEIDTNGYDNQPANGDHLCNLLRQVLPRLHHFRVRLANLCPAIFGYHPADDPFTWIYVTAPSLQTLVINGVISVHRFTGSARACDPGYGFRHRPHARHLLTDSLPELVEDGKFPTIERLWLITFWNQWGTEYRHLDDFLQKKNWLMPHYLWDDNPLDDQHGWESDRKFSIKGLSASSEDETTAV